MIGELVSIIIPVFNCGNEITKCIDMLKAQSFKFACIQVIIVNDGSTDNTDEVCLRAAEKYANVEYITLPHRGVSAARNAGINVARGKYIFFLDADDEITSNTIEDCIDVFDKYYDDIDLLTYPIETVYRGEVLKTHFRYSYLVTNGVYDLTSNAYIGQTTMNIVVKNRFENNIFFDEEMTFSEDQKYCCEVCSDKLKIGFCSSAKYIYYRSDESSSGNLSGACFIFEKSMKMFEDIFAKYEHVPMAFQGLYVNDIYWKIQSNIFFPYHYENEAFEIAMERVKRLLRRCYNCVIMDHPNIDFFEKFYLMRLKGEDSVDTFLKRNNFGLISEGYTVLKQDSVELVVTKLKILSNQRVRIWGFLKSAFFQFCTDEIKLFYIISGRKKVPIELFSSSHNYYLSHESTQKFLGMTCEINMSSKKRRRVKFEVHIGSFAYPVSFYFMPTVPLSHINGISHYENQGLSVDVKNNSKLLFSKKNECFSEELWLYYDCKGVSYDNGLVQFSHDSKKHDSVRRVYVVSDKRQIENLPTESEYVMFGSAEHEELIKKATKVITAYIELNNIIPYDDIRIDIESNNWHFDVIYLQHGVMHIDMPWKYSADRMLADKIVVSTREEAERYTNSGYGENQLIKTGMPRLRKTIGNVKENRRILFAPSWRSYLVGRNVAGMWDLLDKKFLASNYYLNIKNFLISHELIRLLEENDIYLDVKLHPIFSPYTKYFFKENSNRIQFIENVNISDYDLLLTDFSSFLFDFLYNDIPIISFIPDKDEFLCGMNGYRKVDFMAVVDENQIAFSGERVVQFLFEYLQSGKAMDYHVSFYTSINGSDAADLIYQELMG